VAKFDWDEAAKRDYIAKHGSVPFWVGLGLDEDPSEEREVALRVRLQATLDELARYAKLTDFERQRQYPLVHRRLCLRFDEERRALSDKDERLLGAVDEYERGLLSLLSGLRPRP
jgi:hypothetical protein